MINENIAEQFIRPRAVWNIYVPYEDNPACGKVRPALIVKVLESEIHAALILPIYSNRPFLHNKSRQSDYSVTQTAEVLQGHVIGKRLG